MPSEQHIFRRNDWPGESPEAKEWRSRTGEIETTIRGWVEKYKKTLVIDGTPLPVESCVILIGNAWQYFWMDSLEFWRKTPNVAGNQRPELNDVAKKVRGGIRPTTGKKMGGDPFRDLVLCCACLSGCDSAIRILSCEYESVFESAVRGLRYRWLDDWGWPDVISRLVLTVDRKKEDARGLLSKFPGKTSLKAWLGTVFRNLLRDYARERLRRPWERSGSANLSMIPAYTHPQVGNFADVPTSVRRLLLSSLQNLQQRHVLVIYLFYGRNMSNLAAAKILGIDPGNASRRRNSALRQLVSVLEESLQTAPEWLQETVQRFRDRGNSRGDEEEWVESLLQWADLRCEHTPFRFLFNENPPDSGMSIPTVEQSRRNLPLQTSERRVSKTRTGRTDRADLVTRQPQKVAEGTSLPAQLPLSSPEDPLAALIPDRDMLLGASPKDPPESILGKVHSCGINDRPSVVCVDARGTDPHDTGEWLFKFQALLSEQVEHHRTAEVWCPEVAVVLDSGCEFDIPESVECQDLIWVSPPENDVRSGDVLDIYLDEFRRGLERLLKPSLEQFGTVAPKSETMVPFTETLSPEEREDWLGLISE